MAFLKPAKKRNTQTGKFAACLGLVLALTPVAKAQQFQTPTIPGQTTIAIPPQFQARMEHAQALKAQMIRAQIEQGAPSEFAVKAFEAQQAYQAERAFAEYSAYLKKQEQLQKDQLRSGQLDVANDESTSSSDIAQVAYRPPMKRIPKPDQYDSDVSQATANVPSQSTFVPPVHIAPVANFSDEPKVQPSPPAQPLYSYQPVPVSNQLPPTRHAQRPTLALAQSPAAHRNPVLQQGTTDINVIGICQE